MFKEQHQGDQLLHVWPKRAEMMTKFPRSNTYEISQWHQAKMKSIKREGIVITFWRFSQHARMKFELSYSKSFTSIDSML